MNTIFTTRAEKYGDLVKQKKRTTPVTVEQLVAVADALHLFYSRLEENVEIRALKRHLSDIASHCDLAKIRMAKYRDKTLSLPTNLVQSLFKVKTWYELLEADFEFTSDQSVIDVTNQKQAEYIAVLRQLPRFIKDTNIKFLLSDWAADLQLTHDQVTHTLHQIKTTSG